MCTVPRHDEIWRVSGRGLGLAALALLLAGSSPCGADDRPAPRHLIYLHGRIVQEQQSTRPRHPRFGTYEMEAILAAFRERGFVVTGEIRPKSVTVGDAADRVVAQVRRLLEAGVPPDHVTVVGGSMGAGIALVASTRLQEPGLRFALLGACLSESVRTIRTGGGRSPSGHVLSIREASDDMTEPCSAWRDPSPPGSPLEVREIVLHTGLRHGFLYRPLPEWVDPVVKWALAQP
jgi:pimeloyl-ACP methyl ester carboxylesterase